jgi:hypothetical protein
MKFDDKIPTAFPELPPDLMPTTDKLTIHGETITIARNPIYDVGQREPISETLRYISTEVDTDDFPNSVRAKMERVVSVADDDFAAAVGRLKASGTSVKFVELASDRKKKDLSSYFYDLSDYLKTFDPFAQMDVDDVDRFLYLAHRNQGMRDIEVAEEHRIFRQFVRGFLHFGTMTFSEIAEKLNIFRYKARAVVVQASLPDPYAETAKKMWPQTPPTRPLTLPPSPPLTPDPEQPWQNVSGTHTPPPIPPDSKD